MSTRSGSNVVRGRHAPSTRSWKAGRGQAARGREMAGTQVTRRETSEVLSVCADLRIHALTCRAGDGNRTRITSLEGWCSSH